MLQQKFLKKTVNQLLVFGCVAWLVDKLVVCLLGQFGGHQVCAQVTVYLLFCFGCFDYLYSITLFGRTLRGESESVTRTISVLVSSVLMRLDMVLSWYSSSFFVFSLCFHARW